MPAYYTIRALLAPHTVGFEFSLRVLLTRAINSIKRNGVYTTLSHKLISKSIKINLYIIHDKFAFIMSPFLNAYFLKAYKASDIDRIKLIHQYQSDFLIYLITLVLVNSDFIYSHLFFI